ncbi:MAG: sugar ABC transporter substrate-binding protein [Lachnospiraceae bacterium]|nr:sugar ABC transporter substrate-binding protein [Lachnospiraceae bacterium]
MKKRTMAGILAAVMALSVAGCGGNSAKETTAAGNAAAGSEAAGEVSVSGKTLKVLAPEEPGSEDALNNAIDKWAAEAGVTIDRIIISHDDQLTKFPAMAKNKDLPDLIQTTRLHQLYPEEFMDMSTVVDLSKFEESALKIVGKDYKSDKISGLPSQFTTTNFYYNADAFKAAGVEVPTVEKPWTWDELYENAAKIQASGAVKYGFAADVSRARYDILMYANGGSLVKQDGDTFKVNVNCPENVATLESFVKANADGVMPKAIWAGGSTDNPVEYFKNGDAAILLSGSWNYNSMLTDVTKFEFGVMPSPKGSVSQAAIIGGSALAIPENAKNKDVAAEFVKWFYEEENFKDYLQNDKGLSSLNTVVYEPADEKAAADFKLLQNEVGYVTDTFMVDESSAWRTYKDNEYRDYIKRAVSGELSAKDALDAFAKELSESSKWEMAQ